MKNSAVSTSHSSLNTDAQGHPRITVVIPTLNEADNLPHVLPLLPAIVDEVIIVDGGSKDRTVEIARELRPDVRIIVEPRRGKGLALRMGFGAAHGDIIVMMDADGSNDPNEIHAFVERLREGADFVKGSRFYQGGYTDDMEWYRRLGNMTFVVMVNVLFGSRYTDLCYGYNAFWARVIPELGLDADGFEIETQLNVRVLQQRLHVVETPSVEKRRIHGTSNLNTVRDGWRILVTIVREWLRPPRTARRVTKVLPSASSDLPTP